MEKSIISLETLSHIVEYDLKSLSYILEEGNDDSNKDRIRKVFSYLIIHHIETAIGQLHREDRNLINDAIKGWYDCGTMNVIINDRLRCVYINTLRNRLSKLDQLEDAIKEQLDTISVDYTDDYDEDE